MEALSLLEGCQSIFEKSHDIWKSYFSRWETLAGLEKDLPDEAFVSEENASKKKQKNKGALLKSKRKLKEQVVGKKKVAKKNKKKTAGEVIEQSEGSGNENLPEETDNKQLEMHLRTIFMDILKANRNKWEVFAVLSQTFSHGDVTVKGPHSLRPNHRPALPSNDIEGSEGNLLFRELEIFLPKTWNAGIRSDEVEFFGSSFSTLGIRRKETPSSIVPQFRNNTFNKLWDDTRQPFPEATFTPPNVGIIREFKSCPPTLRSNLGGFKLKPPSLDFRGESTPKSWRRAKNEYFLERNVPEMNITREEKRSGSLCLHKRTNDLNMENSNFMTPERNPSKRKCFSENVSERKRRRRTKLFFDFWDSSDSENEQTKGSTPRIGWRGEFGKINITEHSVAGESDSESESIL